MCVVAALHQTCRPATAAAHEVSGLSAPVWRSLWDAGFADYFSTVRDVRRFANAVPVAVELLGKEIAFGDLVVLEALRVFAPDTFIEVSRSIEQLAPPDGAGATAEAIGRLVGPFALLLLPLLISPTLVGAASRRHRSEPRAQRDLS